MKIFKRKAKNETRSYQYCLKNMKPDAGRLWGFVHRIDYLICKILYPGIDGLDYFLYKFYDIPHSVRKTFITEGDLAKMVKLFNGDKKTRNWARFKNKKRFNTQFNEYIGRKWIGDEVSKDEFFEFCKSFERLIIKPNGGLQGRGIFFSKIESDDDVEALYKKVHRKGYIIEEVITQNHKLATLHPKSVNTLRVYTTRSMKDGKLHITCAVIRMGRGNSKIDNYTSGGIVAEIDVESGIVMSRGVDEVGNEFLKHPDTGVAIKGFEVPEWEKVKENVLKIHELVKDLGYIAWDVVVRENGDISFLEANLFGGVHMQQQPSMKGKKEIYRKLM